MKKLILSLWLLGSLASSSFASVVVTNGLTHKHQVQSSATEKGIVILKNIGTNPERILVYFNDLKVGCNSEQLDVAEPGSLERSNSSWIKVGLQERLLQPGEEYPLQYNIKTPDSRLEGTYWSLLMIEVKKPIDTASNSYGVKVNSNIRYAVQIITDFGTQEATNVSFNNVELAATSQGKSLIIQLSNNCNKLVIPSVKLEIYDSNGELLFEKKADTKKLYPTQCRNFALPVNELPLGKYQAVLVADCGQAEYFGMTLNLEVDE